MATSFSDLTSDGLVRHNVSLMRFDAKLRRQIRGQLRKLRFSIEEQLGSVDFSNVARKAQLERLLKQVDQVVKGSYRGMNKFMAGEMGDLALAEQNFAAQQLNSLFAVDLATANIPPAALRALSKDANIFGAPAAEHWGRQSARMRQKFADQMREGFLLGESTQDLVRRVRGSATGARQIVEIGGRSQSVAVFSGGIMDVTTKEAEALVRTSVSAISNEIRLETYEANQDVIKAVQAQVTLDNRTSDICIAHGAIPDTWSLPDYEPLNGSNHFVGPPPWHFNCRSSLVPITKSWSELQAQGSAKGATRKQKAIARKLDNNAPKATRASMDGQVPKGIGYDAWLKKQPASVQLEVLGPTRRKLWKQGKLNLSQTIDQTGRPMSLKQMGMADAAITGVPTTVPTARRVGLEPDAFVAPPTLPTVTNAGLTDVVVGQEFMYLDNAYKAHKVTTKGVEALPWSTRTGKFVTARNRKTLAFKAKKPITPPKPPGQSPHLFGKIPEGVTIKRADDFSTTGTYEVRIPGNPVKKIYRDPDTGFWYLEQASRRGPTPQPALLGFTGKEAMKDLLDSFPPIKGAKVPPVKPTTTTGMPKAPVVESANYRGLTIDDIFKDAEGNVWKVYGKSNRGVKVVPWSTKSNRFLAKRNGRTLGFTSEPAKTVKQFKQSSANATEAVSKLFRDDGRYGLKIVKLTEAQKESLAWATETMGKNGFNKVLADRMRSRGLSTSIFNMGKGAKIDPWGHSTRGSRSVLGSYWQVVKATGMTPSTNKRRMIQTWIHEFGHHMDYSLFRNRATLLKTSTLSANGEVLLAELDNAYKAMIREYRAASKAVGKDLGLRMRGGIMSEAQQKKNWGRIERVMKGRSQSSYSLHNEKEWFAETFAAYFDTGGNKALMAKWQPETKRFFETMLSKEMEPLWKELLLG